MFSIGKYWSILILMKLSITLRQGCFVAYYAHSDNDNDKSRWHLLSDHLRDTANTAAEFGRSFGAEKLSGVAGLLHDLGRYSFGFQQRLEGRGIRVDHSTPGAQEAVKRYGPAGLLLAYVVSGHHCGLPDWGSKADESSLEARLSKKLIIWRCFQ